MTPKEILEGNSIIAEFMGYKFYPNNSINGTKGVYEKKNRLPKLITSFKYHSSWDCLIPIIKKIELYKNVDSAFVVSMPLYTEINIVWVAVVEFIKYWNNEKAKS